MKKTKLSLCFVMLAICVMMVGCKGTYEYKVQALPEISFDEKFPESVSLSVSSEEIYNHDLGFKSYKIYVKDSVVDSYEYLLKKSFSELLPENQTADVNLRVTTLDTSIFPIAGIIIDIRLYFKVEIFDKKMRKEKTVMIYGFGSDSDGNRAMEKAVKNSFYQLLPTLDELYVKE